MITLQIYNRIDRAGSDLVEIGLEMQRMVADGAIDQDELRRLTEIVHREIPTVAEEIEDIAPDMMLVQQILRVGRHRSPNRHLQDRIKQTDNLLQFRQREAASQASTPDGAA